MEEDGEGVRQVQRREDEECRDRTAAAAKANIMDGCFLRNVVGPSRRRGARFSQDRAQFSESAHLPNGVR